MIKRNASPITATQHRLLQAIESFTAEYGYAPITTDLMDVMGWTSPGTVAGALKVLEGKGLITRVPGKARTLKVVK